MLGGANIELRVGGMGQYKWVFSASDAVASLGHNCFYCLDAQRDSPQCPSMTWNHPPYSVCTDDFSITTQPGWLAENTGCQCQTVPSAEIPVRSITSPGAITRAAKVVFQRLPVKEAATAAPSGCATTRA